MGLLHGAIYFVITALLLGLAATPLFKPADDINQSGRITGIDGLRGFLALGVFFHHAAIYQVYLGTQKWALPAAALDVLLGQGGVALFFMITAYLFWGRVIRGIKSWPQLYLGRLFRIGPLYLFATAVLLAVVAVASHMMLLESPLKVAIQVIRWLALGIGGQPDVNQYTDTGRILTGVTWSLKYEWAFYFGLAGLALFRRLHLQVGLALLVLALVITALFPKNTYSTAACLGLFAAGMLCASVKWLRPAWAVSDRQGSSILLLLLIAVLSLSKTAYSPLSICLLGLVFYLVVSGATLFGLLSSRAAIRLGNLSYGIYLLQGLIFIGGFAIGPVRAAATRGPYGYWLVIAGMAMSLSLFALAMHRLIEHPGIALGKHLAARVGTSHTPGLQPGAGKSQSTAG